MRRLDHLDGLLPAHPSRHHHALGVDIVEAIALHRIGGPGDRAREVVGSADPLAEGVGQLSQAVPRKLIRRRCLHQLVGVGAIRIEPPGPALRVGGDREGSNKTEENNGSMHP